MAEFPSFGIALDRVKKETGITDRDASFRTMLEASKGTLSGVDEYRPHFVIGWALMTNISTQTLARADDGITFRYQGDRANLIPVIEGHWQIQQNLDVSQSTVVPDGFDIKTWIDRLNGVTYNRLGAMVG